MLLIRSAQSDKKAHLTVRGRPEGGWIASTSLGGESVTIAVQLAILGVVVLLFALAQYVIRGHFGERGRRVSTIGAAAFVVLGALVLGLAGVLAFVEA